MACTTILVGKDASYDGSTIIARNEDSANGEFCPKRFIVVKPEDQPRKYKSVLSHVEIDLPDNPLQYTAVPNADLKEGIWGEAGVNEANVAMSATETLTTNERVLGADPFVELTPAKRAMSRKSPVALAKRISLLSCCRTSPPPVRVWNVWALCLRSMARMR